MKQVYRCFILLISALGIRCSTDNNYVMTVNGPVPVNQLGTVLTHEHFLVDFIGADLITDSRWDRAKVASAVLPYLREVKKSGCNAIIECTPEYLGRDPLLLKMLADSTGLNLVTNTDIMVPVTTSICRALSMMKLRNNYLRDGLKNGMKELKAPVSGPVLLKLVWEATASVIYTAN